jgi:hypothetical protein
MTGSRPIFMEENMDFNGLLDGTWDNGSFKVLIKGKTYVSFYNGFRYGKGTIKYDNENVTLTSSHAHLIFFLWTPFVEVIKGKFILTNDELTVSNVEGRYNAQNGKWIKINSTRKERP